MRRYEVDTTITVAADSPEKAMRIVRDALRYLGFELHITGGTRVAE